MPKAIEATTTSKTRVVIDIDFLLNLLREVGYNIPENANAFMAAPRIMAIEWVKNTNHRIGTQATKTLWSTA